MIQIGMRRFMPTTRQEETNGHQQPRCSVQISEVGTIDPFSRLDSQLRTAFGTVDHNIHRKRRVANSRLYASDAIANAESMVQEQVERLSEIFQRYVENGEVLELRKRFLAFTTDTVALHTLGQSMDLQSDERRAEEWHRTIRTVAKLTPFAKQFPWVIDVVRNLPVGPFKMIMPDMARLLQLHHVRLSHKSSHYLMSKFRRLNLIPFHVC